MCTYSVPGFVNTTLPLIVFSANHLAVRYPRCVVILIETLPALVTKLCLPHFLHHVPYWMRPLSAGAIWILVVIIIKTTPTNIAPPPRIFTSMLASSAAAAVDVSFLGMTRYYGRVGLAGWGAGVGAGTLSCAALAFILARGMETFVPCLVGCIYARVGAMLFAFFVILPGAPVNYPETR